MKVINMEMQGTKVNGSKKEFSECILSVWKFRSPLYVHFQIVKKNN